MKQLVIFLFFILSFPIMQVHAQDQKSLSNEEIKAKINILEERLNDVEKNLNIRFDAVNTRIDAVDIKLTAKIDALDTKVEILFWFQGIIVALIIFLLGFVIWDRRTALKPALDKASAADEKCSNLLRALRNYAQKHPELENILKTHGLM